MNERLEALKATAAQLEQEARSLRRRYALLWSDLHRESQDLDGRGWRAEELNSFRAAADAALAGWLESGLTFQIQAKQVKGAMQDLANARERVA